VSAGVRSRPDRKAASVPSPDTVVRDAVATDAMVVSAIGRRAVPATYAGLCDAAVIEGIVEQSYAPGALRECIARCARADAHFLVAERESRVVGFLHYDCEGPEPELHRIYVEPDRKRSGIGSALLAELHARLSRGDSYVLMVVADNLPAISFYRRQGFVELAQVDGPTYMQERMGVQFPNERSPVPAYVMRYEKT
jgi:ribosomal protein S18 acetylase RimI-like enzyme